ncbi:hypothetical protein LuPra_03979 [Luteitalea pratensis]|uniref:Uncharacterized protein n=1 Tax=Luteitalea pratensis TaxID=1855912 RepID=A0A143PRK2_LUTPR|nr:hypothetical protein [Luteitalea pratensis]AMY10740.1 hypothetical protein LuPra_03979 [Luteitalea pratensis]
MAPTVCTVRFEDAEGTVHTVTVSAASLYEAVGLAVQAFAAQPWTPPIPAAAPLTVEVRPTSVEHRVTMQRVRQWAAATATSPADRLHRQRVGALLAGR